MERILGLDFWFIEFFIPVFSHLISLKTILFWLIKKKRAIGILDRKRCVDGEEKQHLFRNQTTLTDPASVLMDHFVFFDFTFFHKFVSNVNSLRGIQLLTIWNFILHMFSVQSEPVHLYPHLIFLISYLIWPVPPKKERIPLNMIIHNDIVEMSYSSCPLIIIQWQCRCNSLA